MATTTTTSTNGDHTEPGQGALPPGFTRRPSRGRRVLTAPGRGLRRLGRDVRNWSELRRTSYGLTPVVILGLLTFVQFFDAQTFSLAGPDIARDTGITQAQIIGVLVTIGVVLVFVDLGIGWWADRHRRLPLIGWGAIASGIFAMFSSRSASSLSLGITRTGDQVGDDGSQVPRLSVIADYYPPEARGKVFSLLGAMRNTAALISPVAVGLMIIHWGWRTTFIVAGGPIIIMGIVVLLRLREPIRGYQERRALGIDDEASKIEDEPLSFGEAWRTVWAVRTLRRVFIASIWSAPAVFAFFFNFFLAENYGLDALQRGIVFFPAILIGLVGNILGGGLIDAFTRRNPSRVLYVRGIMGVISAAGIAGVALQPPLAILVIFECIAAFGSSITLPATQYVYAQVIPPRTRTLGLTVFGLASLFETLIFFPLGSTIFRLYGYHKVFLFVAPLEILGALIAMTAAGFFDVDMRNAFASTAASEEWRRTRASGKGKLLVCRDVEVEYDGVQVLFGVDFDLDDGDIIALLGTNGAGKSTLLRAISGTQEASGGAIVFDGRDITHMPPHEVATRGVIHMPGGRGVFPGLTVRENLLLGTWMSDDEDDVRARLEETFEVFPILKERADALASQLSGGEQQQLSLAQAFLGKPRLLMIDELSLGLSPAVVGQLLDVVRQIHARGTSIIVVEQSVNVALTLAEKAIFMEKGEVKFFGKTADLLQRPDILRAVYVKGTGALTDGAPAGARRSQRDQRNLDLGEAPPVLEVSGITKRFGGVTALDDVSLELREGEVLGIIGPNGSGKTTLFDIISGFQSADEGVIRYEGVDITGLGPDERARRKLVRRFQDARLFGSLTVFETLLIALDQRLEVKSTVLAALQLPQSRRAERRLRVRAERLIELLDIDAYRDKFVRELSTG
ncbi:MAG: branched-chain amino acid transport system ATP-binding protein, partial [Actinomycetota bacterium]|nr:branched-chain amino acid transport system ATP-binding protein [Actinomycetota bacterium]